MILLLPYSPDQVPRREPRRPALMATGLIARLKRVLSKRPRTPEPERYFTVLGGRSELPAHQH